MLIEDFYEELFGLQESYRQINPKEITFHHGALGASSTSFQQWMNHRHVKWFILNLWQNPLASLALFLYLIAKNWIMERMMKEYRMNLNIAAGRHWFRWWRYPVANKCLRHPSHQGAGSVKWRTFEMDWSQNRHRSWRWVSHTPPKTATTVIRHTLRWNPQERRKRGQSRITGILQSWGYSTEILLRPAGGPELTAGGVCRRPMLQSERKGFWC